MRLLYRARLDKVRPVVLMTRSIAKEFLTNVTVAPITTTIRSRPFEVPVGVGNGLEHHSVINLDNLRTIPKVDLLDPIGELTVAQEYALADAVRYCYDLID